jgi:ATP-binding cassette, subfamily B (MDR/TAP), member 7
MFVRHLYRLRLHHHHPPPLWRRRRASTPHGRLLPSLLSRSTTTTNTTVDQRRHPGVAPVANNTTDKEPDSAAEASAIASSSSRHSDWESFWKLSQYVWPSTGNDEKDRRHKARVVASLGFMIAGKAVTIQVPYVFKHLVDTLPMAAAAASASAASTASATTTAIAVVDPTQMALVSVLALYGASRAAATGLQEYRNVVFAVVAQDSIRHVGRRVFDHLLSSLDLTYHLSRNTGQLARTLDRGQRSINFVLTAMVFHIGPTILEVSLVTGLVFYQFGLAQASVVAATVVAYTSFTFAYNER